MAESYSIVYICHILFIHSFVGGIWVVPTFWLLWIILLWTLVHKFWVSAFNFSSFDYIPTSQIAGSDGNPTFSVWGTTKLFSTVPSPFYIPTRNVWGIQFLHTHADTCYFPLKKKKAILVSVKWYRFIFLKEYSGNSMEDGLKEENPSGRENSGDGC